MPGVVMHPPVPKLADRDRRHGERQIKLPQADLLPLFADGRLRPVVDRIYPFDELPEAKAYMESNAHLGKIVVRVG